MYVRQNGKYGFIIGDYKSPVIYDNIYYGREKACVVKLGDKVGVIGPDTNIPCDYKYIFRGIKNSDTFTLIYNINTTKEISDEINLNWNRITIY